MHDNSFISHSVSEMFIHMKWGLITPSINIVVNTIDTFLIVTNL